MIKEMPCGCKTIPIFSSGERFEEYLLNRVAVWFDDPRCMEHEDGTDTVGFMLYKDDEVIAHVTRDGHLKIDKYKLEDAVQTLKDYKKKGFDFSYGFLDMKRDRDGQYTMYCKDETA